MGKKYTYRITKNIVDGGLYITVERIDGASFDGGVKGYNFAVADAENAVKCRERLEKEAWYEEIEE